MPPEILSIFIQIPLVGLFIWYNDRKDKQFQQFLREMRKDDQAILQRLVDKMDQHDEKTDAIYAIVQDRTRLREA